MTPFRYSALALLLAAAPAAAQSLSVDDARSEAFSTSSSFAPVDSLLVDTGDNDTHLTAGYGFPGGAQTPRDPGDFRATRFTTAVVYTVPENRTTSFVLTGVRVRYRTSQVSAATSTPPRIQYDADAPPVVHVFRGSTPPVPAADSLDAPGALFSGRLPLTTRTAPSPADGYPVPQIETHLLSFVPFGQTQVPASFVFQPGESFVIRIQYFNVPNPAVIEAGTTAPVPGFSISTSFEAPFATTDAYTHNGLGVADTVGPDGFEDQWFIRAISDLFTQAGEEGAAQRAVVLGPPSPNPARGPVDLPFALLRERHARVSVYDVTGREVAVVADRAFGSGGQVAEFDASKLAAGVYVVVLEAGGQRATQRLAVVR
ncbi:MAG TPA: T9SS type A sorting domain-containing protein [Rubricoccaceae bacterium]|jgi:hypothetical protein